MQHWAHVLKEMVKSQPEPDLIYLHFMTAADGVDGVDIAAAQSLITTSSATVSVQSSMLCFWLWSATAFCLTPLAFFWSRNTDASAVKKLSARHDAASAPSFIWVKYDRTQMTHNWVERSSPSWAEQGRMGVVFCHMGTYTAFKLAVSVASAIEKGPTMRWLCGHGARINGPAYMSVCASSLAPSAATFPSVSVRIESPLFRNCRQNVPDPEYKQCISLFFFDLSF